VRGLLGGFRSSRIPIHPLRTTNSTQHSRVCKRVCRDFARGLNAVWIGVAWCGDAGIQLCRFRDISEPSSMRNILFHHFIIQTMSNINYGPLPVGWAAYQNPQGQVFYFNHTNGATQWDHPNKPVKKMLPVGKLGLGLAGVLQGSPIDALIGVGIGNWVDKSREKRYKKAGYDVQHVNVV
jgi:hypothetical protein